MIIPPGSIPATTPPGLSPRKPASPPPPSFTPQAVQFPGSPGQGPGVALADHIHAGVHEVIAGNNVTVGGTATSPVISATGTNNPSFRFLADVLLAVPAGGGPEVPFSDNVGHNTYDDPSGMWDQATGRITVQSAGIYLFGIEFAIGAAGAPDRKYNYFFSALSSALGSIPPSIAWPVSFYEATDANGSLDACFGVGWHASMMLDLRGTNAPGKHYDLSISGCADNVEARDMRATFWMARLYPV